jgi:two-component system response regulator YesN
MRVLIADDEANICKLIKNLIDWNALGLEPVGFAENGDDCVQTIDALKPDIVITDIRMPGKSGLDIIRGCYERQLGVRFIIISGHAEFDYAKQALKYGVSDFLLKPINRLELTEALNRITLLTRGKENPPDTEGPARRRDMLLRETLPLSLYHRDFMAGGGIAGLNEALSFKFKDGIFLPAIIKLSAKPIRDSHMKNIWDQIKSVTERELGSICHDMCVCRKGNALLCVFNFPESRKNDFHITLRYAFDKLLDLTSPYTYYLVMGTGAEVRDLKHLQSSFLQAVCAGDSRLSRGSNQIINGSDMDTRLMSVSNITVEEPNRALTPIIETLNREHLRDKLLEQFRQQMPDMNLYPYSAYAYIRKFTESLVRDITAAHIALTESGRETVSAVMSDLSGCQSVGEAEDMIAFRFSELFGKAGDISPDRKAIGAAKEYIDKYFNRHIRLEDVAQNVYLSPAYFGILFKRETGENFSDYLVKVRIEKAKEMLRDIRYNINEIAENVGYKDTRYFSRLFKSIVGVNPTQYRQMLPAGRNRG